MSNRQLSSAASHGRGISRRFLRVAMLGLAVITLMGGECDPKGPDFFDTINGGVILTGTVTGQVTVDGSGASGVAVTLRDGGMTIGTTTTGQGGTYQFTNVPPGSKTVSIATPSGATCPTTQQDVTVPAGGTATANFACTTPTPQTGTVTGQVTVNGSGESGVAVTLRMGDMTVGTTTTGQGGTYQFTNVPTGSKTVSIATPSGATCPGPQNVTVPAGGTATANFACTRPSGDFTLTSGSPAPGYCHIQPGQTGTYAGFWTTPAQIGAPYSVSWTGPGTVGGTMRTGTTGATGGWVDQQDINQFGTYTFNAMVMSGSVSRTTMGSVNVTSAQGACQQPSSLRYKQAVVALLPDDVRPLGLRPVAFRYVEPWGDPTVPRIGLVAEEVVEVFPEAVGLDPHGRPGTINYGALSRLVVEAAVARTGEAVEEAIARLGSGF
jgi:hypothetical protein